MCVYVSCVGGAGPVSSAVTGSPSASGGGTPQPLVVDPTAILPVSGNTATAVNKMLSELPPELQPVVLAKVAVKGRGGRQPAADPRDLDPNMDPRKVRFYDTHTHTHTHKQTNSHMKQNK